MALRALLLAIVAILVFPVANADPAVDMQKWMPKEASVVVPLLKEIKSGDKFSKVYKILGIGLTPNVNNKGQPQWYCMLDDGTQVQVEAQNHIVVSMDVMDVKGKMLYSTSQTAR